MSIGEMSRAEIIKAANSHIRAQGLKVLSISSALSRACGATRTSEESSAVACGMPCACRSDMQHYLLHSLGVFRSALTVKQRAVFDALLKGDLHVALDTKGRIASLAIRRVGG